jgi:two-component system capsular synthesis sensor histidine kinase RcsC
MNLSALHLPFFLPGYARPPRGRASAARLLLGQFQRNLLFAGTGLLSLMMLLALGLMVGVQVDRYHTQRVDDFTRVRLLLEQELGRHDSDHARLATMAEFAWRHHADAPGVSGDVLRDRYLADSEHLRIAGDARSGARTALGLGTAHWQPAELERYLQLSRALSLIGRLTGNDGSPADNAYFFDASGRFLSLHPGVDKGRLQRALGLSDRQTLFNHLRKRANLPAPSSAQDLIPALRGVGQDRRAQLSFGPHPLSGEPSLVTTFYARDGAHPIGVFVTFEPMSRLERLLRQTSSSRLALVGTDGHAVATTDGGGLPPQPALRAVVAQADDSTTVTTLRQNGHVMLASSVPGTPWALVESYSWRDVLDDGRHLLGIGSLLILLSLVTLWVLVLRLNRRWFQPALRQMDTVYESERLCRTAVAESPTALCLLVRGRAEPLLCNPAMQALLDMVGQGGVRIIECLRAGYAQYRGADETGEIAVRFPLTVQPVGGTASRHLWVEAVAAGGAQADALLFSVQDVTALADREHEQVVARERAEAESRAKSAFLATVSHEIRTPLHGILGHLELLDRPGLEAPQRMRIQRIRQSADSLLDIIRDVLDLSRMEFEPLEVEPVVYEPEVLMERVALLFAPLAYAKGVDLDYRLDPAVPAQVRGQEEQVERVLRNLASNAVKFTGSGRIELRAHVCHVGAEARLCFEVADSGIGMSGAQQARVFQPFTQADESIRGRFGGSGLGLFLCHQLCSSMGGSIHVHSTQGVGTLFSFDVPLQAVIEVAAAQPLIGRSVLLLSPSPIWGAELERRLQRWGMQVQRLTAASELAGLDVPSGVPLVVFERGESHLLAASGAGCPRTVIHVRVDGPLRPEPVADGWVLSAYAAEALLRVLQRQDLMNSVVHGMDVPVELELSHSAQAAP